MQVNMFIEVTGFGNYKDRKGEVLLHHIVSTADGCTVYFFCRDHDTQEFFVVPHTECKVDTETLEKKINDAKSLMMRSPLTTDPRYM